MAQKNVNPSINVRELMERWNFWRAVYEWQLWKHKEKKFAWLMGRAVTGQQGRLMRLENVVEFSRLTGLPSGEGVRVPQEFMWDVWRLETGQSNEWDAPLVEVREEQLDEPPEPDEEHRPAQTFRLLRVMEGEPGSFLRNPLANQDAPPTIVLDSLTQATTQVTADSFRSPMYWSSVDQQGGAAQVRTQIARELGLQPTQQDLDAEASARAQIEATTARERLRRAYEASVERARQRREARAAEIDRQATSNVELNDEWLRRATSVREDQ